MKKLTTFLFAIMLFCSIAVSVSADEILRASLDKESCGVGEYIRVTAAYNGSVPLGAFLANMKYDSDSLRYVKTENISGDYVKSADTAGNTRTVFATDKTGKGELFTVVYKVLPGATKAEVSVAFYDVVDSDGSKLDRDSSTDLSALVIVPSGDALLLDLIPSSGELNEDFSPSTNKYTMSVPYEVKSMSFQVSVSAGAKCSINRKNLGSGGSTTDYILTVTSEDEKTKNLYTVSVTRGEYVRPSATTKTENSDDGSSVSSESYETVSPEYTGEEEMTEDEISAENALTVPEESASITKAETPLGQGGNLIYFLAGTGVCLACVFAGVLIAMIFSKTGKHGKH